MTKPLELVVFEKEPGRYGREPTYNSPDGEWAYSASHADGYALNKSLTDPELAAEYWHARDDADCRRHRVDRGADNPGMSADEAEDFERVMHRFATLPHASDNGYE